MQRIWGKIFVKFSKKENRQGLCTSKEQEIYTNPETKSVKLFFCNFTCKASYRLPDIKQPGVFIYICCVYWSNKVWSKIQLITRWSIVLLENAIWSQLVKRFSAFYRISVRYHIHKTPFIHLSLTVYNLGHWQ